MAVKDNRKRVDVLNRKAGFNFHIEQRYEAGMVLWGGEVKSIRNGNVNMGDAYCVLEDGEVYLLHMHISEFKQSSYNVHEPMRKRKLLLNKQEIKKLRGRLRPRGTRYFRFDCTKTIVEY